MRGAFKSGVPWVVGSVSGNLSHPVYAGQLSARDRRELAGPLPGHSSSLSLSFLSVPGLLLLKIPVGLQIFPHRLPPINAFKPKTNTPALPRCPQPQEYDRGGIKLLIKRILFMQQAHQGWPNHTAPPPLFILISKYRFNRAVLPYVQCPRKFQSKEKFGSKILILESGSIKNNISWVWGDQTAKLNEQRISLSPLREAVCSFGPVISPSASLTSASELASLSGTCRIWQPCWRAAQHVACGLWSTWWWGVPGPEERSRAWRRPRGSACCRGAESDPGTEMNRCWKHVFTVYCCEWWMSIEWTVKFSPSLSRA